MPHKNKHTRRVFYQPRDCSCNMDDYLLWVSIPRKFPNYGHGPMPNWVSCDSCNKTRHNMYPETNQPLKYPCEKKPNWPT